MTAGNPTESAAAAATTAAAGSPETTPARLPNVPHNLGMDRAANSSVDFPLPQTQSESNAADSLSAAPSAPSVVPQTTQPQTTQPHTTPPASATPHAQTPQPQTQQQMQQPSASQRGEGRRMETPPASSLTPKQRIDRFVSILLLASGALGTLLIGQTMLGLSSQLHIMLAPVVQDPQIPAFVQPLSQGTALGVLILYVVTLLGTIARLRSKKLSFWLPLSAGALAGIVAIGVAVAVLLIAIPQDVLSDPEKTKLMLDALSTVTRR